VRTFGKQIIFTWTLHSARWRASFLSCCRLSAEL
jgi:hypothetical protein